MISSSPYTFTGLTPSTDYEWRVCKVCNDSTNSDWATSTFTTADDAPPAPCDPPTDLTVSNIRPHSAILSWEGSGTFQVSYRPDSIPSWSEPITIQSNRFTLDHLDDTALYYCRVRKVCDEGGISDWVDTSFMTPDGSGIATAETAGTAITLYPNPASSGSSVTLEVSGAEGFVAVSLLDVKGCQLHRSSQLCPSDCTLHFDLPSLPSGTYFVRVQTSSRTAVEKLVVK